MKLVTVLIPTYNRKSLVLEAIASVKAQTYPRIEIIVADDGSDDGTVEALAATDGIRWVQIPHSGQAHARNAALALASGDYLCCLDADDLWSPSFVEKCVGAMESLDTAFVFANWTSLEQGGAQFPSYFEKKYHWWLWRESERPEWRVLWPAETRAMYVDSCMSPSSAMMLRRELVQGWNESLEIGDDWCLALELSLREQCKIAFTMEPLWSKRVIGDNVYDRRNRMEVLQKLHIGDIRKMRNQLRGQLTCGEYSRMSAHIVYFKLQLIRMRPMEIIRQARRLAITCLQGLLHSPAQFSNRLTSLSPRLRQWQTK